MSANEVSKKQFSFRQRLKKHLTKSDGHALGMDGLLSREELKRELSRERARADRSGQPFSLMLVDVLMPREQAEYDKALKVLTTVLNRRLRAHDSKGWYGDRVGVILPDVTTETAPVVWKAIEAEFIANAHADLPKRLPLPELSYEVFTYPNVHHQKNGRDPFRSGSGENKVYAVKSE